MNLNIERNILFHMFAAQFLFHLAIMRPRKHRRLLGMELEERMFKHKHLYRKNIPIDTISSSTQAPTIFTVF